MYASALRPTPNRFPIPQFRSTCSAWSSATRVRAARLRRSCAVLAIREPAVARIASVVHGRAGGPIRPRRNPQRILPLYGRDVVGLTTPQLGSLFGVQTVTRLAIRPLIGFVSDRAGRRWVIAAGLVVCSTAVLGVSGAADLWALAAAVVAYTAGVATMTASTSAYITDVTVAHATGLRMSSSAPSTTSATCSVRSPQASS